jgi:hypothetical protein
MGNISNFTVSVEFKINSETKMNGREADFIV